MEVMVIEMEKETVLKENEEVYSIASVCHPLVFLSMCFLS